MRNVLFISIFYYTFLYFTQTKLNFFVCVQHTVMLRFGISVWKVKLISSAIYSHLLPIQTLKTLQVSSRNQIIGCNNRISIFSMSYDSDMRNNVKTRQFHFTCSLTRSRRIRYTLNHIYWYFV